MSLSGLWNDITCWGLLVMSIWVVYFYDINPAWPEARGVGGEGWQGLPCLVGRGTSGWAQISGNSWSPSLLENS